MKIEDLNREELHLDDVAAAYKGAVHKDFCVLQRLLHFTGASKEYPALDLFAEEVWGSKDYGWGIMSGFDRVARGVYIQYSSEVKDRTEYERGVSHGERAAQYLAGVKRTQEMEVAEPMTALPVGVEA